MRLLFAGLFAVTVCGACLPASAQGAARTVDAPARVVPHVVRYSGTLPGLAEGGPVEVRFAVYAGQNGGEPLWGEVQRVAVDAGGKYSVLLGAVTALPDAVFGAGEGRWVGVSVAGGEEGARTPIAASAYALKAEDAETLGGHPVSDFALADMKAKPDTGTNITQINVSSGILGGGTGPTVSLSADPSYFNASYAQLAAANTFSAANTFAKGFASTVATGTAPFTVASTTAVPNLNASLLGGVAAAGYAQLAAQNTFTNNEIFGPSAPATTSTGHSSNFLWLNASVWNSSKNLAQNIGFQWRAEPLNNNTASPNANFALLSTVTSATPQETGFKITANGIVTFVAGQTFPGAGTITGVTAGTGLTGGGTSGAVSLAVNPAALETTYDARYAQLGAANTYVDPQTISGAAPIGGGTGTYTGELTVNNSNAYGVGVAANSPYIGMLASGMVATTSIGGNGDTNTTGTGTGEGVDAVGGVGVVGVTEYNGATASGTGVYGEVPTNYMGTGPAPMGVYGYNGFTAGYGVFGIGPSAGVYGSALATQGSYGVYGTAPLSTGWGVRGVSNSPSTRGGFVTTSDFGAGVWADTSNTADDDSSSFGGPALYATADNNYAAVMVNNSSSYTSLYVANSSTGGTVNDTAPVFAAAGKSGVCGVDGSGDVTCSGRLKTAVESGGKSVELYSMQSAENWFEDFGSARLENGVVHVALEPQFAGLVNTGVEYHVFLTPQGECEGLYVAGKGDAGFEVRELHHGTSSVAFDYRIVAKRTGHEAERLVDATAAMRKMTAPRDRMDRLEEEALAHPEKRKAAVPPPTVLKHGRPAGELARAKLLP